MQEIEFQSGVIKPIECVKEGWALIKSDYWLLFAISIVAGLIGGISLFILLGAMCCGSFKAYLNKIDGKPVSFEDLFKGFSYFWPSLIVTIVIVVPMLIVYGVIYVPIIMSAVMGSRLSPEELMGMLLGAFAVDLVIVVIMVCIHSLIIFALPLIVDRGLGGIASMTTSARSVMKNFGGVAGLFGVNFLLILVGELLFCVGVYFVLPVIVATNMVAYRKVFPKLDQEIY